MLMVTVSSIPDKQHFSQMLLHIYLSLVILNSAQENSKFLACNLTKHALYFVTNI